MPGALHGINRANLRFSAGDKTPCLRRINGGKASLGLTALIALSLPILAATTQAQLVEPVGQTSATLSATITISTAGTPTAINLLSQGTANLDFKFVSGGSCVTGTAYSAAATCTVDYTFAPFYPGMRMGGITLTNSTGTVLASANISGIGTGPQVAFSGTSTVVNPLGGGYSAPWGVATDAAGNVYVGDYGIRAVEEVPAGCVSSSCKVALGGGFTSPTGVAVDGLGDVYVADLGAPAVKEIPQGCKASSCVATLGAGFNAPRGIAVDASGNVYVSDGSIVKKIPPGCANSSCVTSVANGFGDPGQIAIDQSGNLYVTDDSQNQVEEIPSGCTTSSCRIALGGGFLSPYGVAVDAGGRVYVASSTAGNVSTMQPGCTSSSCVTLLTSGLSTPYNLALDGSGNLYAASKQNNTVEQIALATAPIVNFPTTTMDGTTDTTDGTQTVQFYNDGNESLSLTGLSDGTDFPEASDYTNACNKTTSLASGAECVLPITFAPQNPANGALSEDVTLTDNALNASGTTHKVYESGTALYVTYKLTISANNSAYGKFAPASGGSYTAGSVVTITATPNSGYYFENWTGSADIETPTSSSTGILMNGPESIQANFAAIPGFVVTTTADDATGLAANCPSSNNCSLRDALAAATAAGAGNITFSPTVFATPQTIKMGTGGTFVVPPNTSINGPTTGSGTTLTQLVTIQGSGSNEMFHISGNGNVVTIGGLAFVNDIYVNTASTIDTSSPLNVINCAFSDAFDGGAILTTAPLTVTNSSFTDNYALDAGGGAISSTAQLTVLNSSFTGNSAGGSGGAINTTGALTVTNSTFNNNTVDEGAEGGAIYAAGASMVTDSTFENNSALVRGNIGYISACCDGGAIAANSALSVTNSTFINNSAGYGGAISAHALLNVTSSTFDGNTATAYNYVVAGRTLEGGGYAAAIYAQSTSVIDNSIFADDIGNGTGGEVDGISGSGNVIADHDLYYGGDACYSCTTNTSAVSGDPLLSALSSYGGQTQTLLPLPGSAAICAGVSESLNGSPLTTDQRGTAVPTTYGSTQCYDIGAVQTEYGLSFTTSPSTTQAATQPLLPAPVLTLTESGNGLTAESVSLTVAAAAGTLSGTATEGTSTNAGATAGQATFTGLSISPAEATDSLTSSLTLTASGVAAPISIAAKSNNFSVGSGNTAPTITSASSTAFTALAQSTFTVTALGYPVPTFTETGNLPSGVTMASNGVLSGTPAAGSVNTYPITIQASNIAGSVTQNFTLTVVNATATILLGNLAQTFAGIPLAASVTTTPANLATTVTYTGIAPTVYTQSTTPPTGVGSYTVNASINNGQGYAGAATGTLVISSASSTVTLGNLNQTYTGSPLSATVTTTPANLAYSISYSGNGYGPTSTPPTNAGSYTVTASITDANYSGTATNTLVIAPAASSIMLSASATSVFLQNPITLTANVTSTAGTPSGTVTFFNGSSVLGQATLSNGVAMLTTSSLAAGTQQITASYQGVGNFSSSATNGSTSLVVDNLNLSISSPSGSAQPGGTTVFTFTVSPTGSATFPSAVTFNVAGGPAGSSYTFSPSTITAGSGSTTVTLTVQVPQSTASSKPASGGPTVAGTGTRMAPFAVAILLLPFAGKLRRVGRGLSWMIFSAFLLVASPATIGGITGCSASVSSAAAQTYNLTITVTAGSLSNTFNATLTVG